jgi:hypothetical protein
MDDLQTTSVSVLEALAACTCKLGKLFGPHCHVVYSSMGTLSCLVEI